MRFLIKLLLAVSTLCAFAFSASAAPAAAPKINVKKSVTLNYDAPCTEEEALKRAEEAQMSLWDNTIGVICDKQLKIILPPRS